MAVTLIDIPTWGDVSLIEAVWTLVGVLVIGVSLYSLPGVYYDFATAQVVLHKDKLRYNSTVILARAYLRRELLRVSVGIAILSVGIYADFQPQILNGITIGQLLITLAFIWIGASQFVQSFLDAAVRRHLLTNLIQENDDAKSD